MYTTSKCACKARYVPLQVMDLQAKSHYYTICTLQNQELNQSVTDIHMDGLKVTLYVTPTLLARHKYENILIQNMHVAWFLLYIFQRTKLICKMNDMPLISMLVSERRWLTLSVQ